MPPPYDPARFSNGPIWVDHVGDVLETTIAPEVEGGTNYAASAATVSPDNYLTLWPDVTGFTEVDRFLEDYGSADPAAIYVVWFGSNDIDPPAEYTEWAFTTLVDMLGPPPCCRRTQVPDSQPERHRRVAAHPGILPPEYAEALSEMTLLWNARLQGLAALFPDSTIRISNVHALKEFIDQFPELFGFTNTTDPCYRRWSDETVCENPEDYGSGPESPDDSRSRGADQPVHPRPLASRDDQTQGLSTLSRKGSTSPGGSRLLRGQVTQITCPPVPNDQETVRRRSEIDHPTSIAGTLYQAQPEGKDREHQSSPRPDPAAESPGQLSAVLAATKPLRRSPRVPRRMGPDAGVASAGEGDGKEPPCVSPATYG